MTKIKNSKLTSKQRSKTLLERAGAHADTFDLIQNTLSASRILVGGILGSKSSTHNNVDKLPASQSNDSSYEF